MRTCRICGRDDNRVQIRAGTGLCCNLCEKIEKKDIDKERALDYLWPFTRDYNTAARSYSIVKHDLEAKYA